MSTSDHGPATRPISSRSASAHMPPPSAQCKNHERKLTREQITIDPFKGPSAVLFLRAITIWTIWPSIVFVTLWALLVTLIDRFVTTFRFQPTLLTVLGTVIGFVVSYRTSSAYERYTEGRKQWSNVILAGRTLARLAWLHLPNPLRLPDASRPITPQESVQGMIERKTLINLVLGFAVSLKHYLRGEHGIYYEDLYHLACFLPKYAFPSGHPIERPDLGFENNYHQSNHTSTASSRLRQTTDHCSVQVDQEKQSELESSASPPQELLPAYNPPKESIYDTLPVLALFRSVWKGTRNATGHRRRKQNYERRIHDDNIPLEILWCIDSYVAVLQQRKVLDVPTTNALLAAVLALSDSLTALERILTTPIPFGYIVHLKLVIWGYLLFLPFQLLSTFKYLTIPAVTLVSIAFLGFLKVGEEIENPFGYDSNDLDMDHFCHNIMARELNEITAYPPPDPNQFFFSKKNMPLIDQKDRRTSKDLLSSNISPLEFQNQLRHSHHHRDPKANETARLSQIA